MTPTLETLTNIRGNVDTICRRLMKKNDIAGDCIPRITKEELDALFQVEEITRWIAEKVENSK